MAERGCRQHNVDTTESDFNDLFGWIGCYSSRGLLARVLYDYPDKKNIRRVKFFTKGQRLEDTIGYNWISRENLKLEDLYDLISHNLNSFETCKIPETSKCWNEILEMLQHYEFIYETINGKHGKYDAWTHKSIKSDADLAKKYSSLTIDAKRYIVAFGKALECDMKNGQAKVWINILVETIIKCSEGLEIYDWLCINPSVSCNSNTEVETITGDCSQPHTETLFNASYSCDSRSPSLDLSSLSLDSISVSDWLCINPSVSCNSNTDVETITGDWSQPHTETLFNASYSCDSRSPSLDSVQSLVSSTSSTSGHSSYGSKVERHKVVPDFCAAQCQDSMDPCGCFPLVGTFKGVGSFSKGYRQNVQQMLSKMFFQDIVFGLLVSTTSFQLSVIIKQRGDLLYSSYSGSFIQTKGAVSRFNLDDFNNMCNFIYQVLNWSKKSKCLISEHGSKNSQ